MQSRWQSVGETRLAGTGSTDRSLAILVGQDGLTKRKSGRSSSRNREQRRSNGRDVLGIMEDIEKDRLSLQFRVCIGTREVEEEDFTHRRVHLPESQ
jgi:hypothetical protein